MRFNREQSPPSFFQLHPSTLQEKDGSTMQERGGANGKLLLSVILDHVGLLLQSALQSWAAHFSKKHFRAASLVERIDQQKRPARDPAEGVESSQNSPRQLGVLGLPQGALVG